MTRIRNVFISTYDLTNVVTGEVMRYEVALTRRSTAYALRDQIETDPSIIGGGDMLGSPGDLDVDLRIMELPLYRGRVGDVLESIAPPAPTAIPADIPTNSGSAFDG